MNSEREPLEELLRVEGGRVLATLIRLTVTLVWRRTQSKKR